MRRKLPPPLAPYLYVSGRLLWHVHHDLTLQPSPLAAFHGWWSKKYGVCFLKHHPPETMWLDWAFISDHCSASWHRSHHGLRGELDWTPTDLYRHSYNHFLWVQACHHRGREVSSIRNLTNLEFPPASSSATFSCMVLIYPANQRKLFSKGFIV